MIFQKNIGIAFLIVVLIFLSATVFWYNNYHVQTKELQRDKLEQKLKELDYLVPSNEVLLRRYVNIYFDLAKIYFEQNEFDKAIELYNIGLRLDSWRTDKLFELAKVYEKVGQYSDARERLKEVMKLTPGPWLRIKAQWHLWLVGNKGGPDKLESVRADIAEGKLKNITIHIVPFAVEDREILEDLRVMLQDTYKVRFALSQPLQVFSEKTEKRGEQYMILSLLRYVSEKYADTLSGPDDSILVVTSHDIGEKNVNFLFGASEPNYSTGIISYNRFKSDNPGQKLLFRRIYTQALCTSGFLLGLTRCSSSGCARSYAHSFAEFQHKNFKLCKECINNLNRLLEKLNDYPEVDWDAQDLIRLQNVKAKYEL